VCRVVVRGGRLDPHFSLTFLRHLRPEEEGCIGRDRVDATIHGTLLTCSRHRRLAFVVKCGVLHTIFSAGILTKVNKGSECSHELI